MPRYTALLLTLATLSATALAQAAYPAGPENQYPIQNQPAPIEHAYRPHNRRPVDLAAGQTLATRRGTASAHVAEGVFLRIGQESSVRALSVDANRTELRVDRGIANISVYHPEENSLILVDLPGGQTDLLKDGLYTFNAATNTMRVVHGEADAYPGNNPAEKPVKVTEDRQVVFNGGRVRSTEFDLAQLRGDLLPENGFAQHGDGGYGAPYGDGFYGYGYPYYAYGYPYGYPYWGYPYWDYGYYPFGFGLGFGYGGFYGGGYRGGYPIGSHPGGFHPGGGFSGGGGGFHGGGGGGGRR